MFFKKLKKTFLSLLLSIYIIPINILAYSDYIIASGENVGIKINLPGILVIDTYSINEVNEARNAGLQKGDIITSINGTKINNTNEMIEQVNSSDDKINIIYIRNGKEYNTDLQLINDHGTKKTCLYVKDSISGIGTLTFIDPNTKLFGALGHEIIESTTGLTINNVNGSIFSSNVTSITPSSRGNPGEKNATLNYNDKEGNIEENTNKGLFGNYVSNIDTKNLYKVADVKDIKKGEAKILTELDDNKIKEYSINILSIEDNDNKTKNLIFEITDKELLEKTNGIIQGMSGSPIIQGDYIIGAVTHVVVDSPTKGYGIFITNMLEEAEN